MHNNKLVVWIKNCFEYNLSFDNTISETSKISLLSPLHKSRTTFSLPPISNVSTI